VCNLDFFWHEWASETKVLKVHDTIMTLKSVSPEQQKNSHLLKFNSSPIFMDQLITFLMSDKTTSG
jgi:hypothetical protein